MPEDNIQPKGLKLKKKYYEAPTEAEPLSPAISPSTPFLSRSDSSRIRRQFIFITAGWLIFLGLSSVLIYFRFFSDLPGAALDSLKRYGMIAVGVVYLISIFLALKDNMFDGLLAIVVPFYPLYYLFFASGSIFLRALGAAFLAAFGFDCLLFLQNAALKLFERVTYWMQHA